MKFLCTFVLSSSTDYTLVEVRDSYSGTPLYYIEKLNSGGVTCHMLDNRYHSTYRQYVYCSNKKTMHEILTTYFLI